MEKDEIRTGLQVAEIKRDLVDNLFYLLGKFHEVATPNDWYLAVAYTVRDRLLSRWVKSAHEYYETKARTVCYLSPEFLIGPQLGMNLLRLNSEQSFRQALQELGLDVQLGGHTEPYHDSEGRYRVRWIPDYVVQGTPYDTAILGFGVQTANLLRLWKAEAKRSFDFRLFSAGDFYGAVHDKVESENITKVLYPNDEPVQGRELRLKQQYFFVSCSLQDMIRLYLQREQTLDRFHEKFAVQLNDTHPSLAIPELMRLLVDEHFFDWDTAWSIAERTFGYTNHTLLSEALERWPLGLITRVLPRHVEIIYGINQRFLNKVRLRFPNDEDKVRRLSLIDESGARYVRMAYLACVGSHAINGVAKLHTRLLEEEVLPDFFEMVPEKFSNKTNGVSQRRFLLLANSRLARLITDAIGSGWIKNLEDLRKLEPFALDAAFRERWRQVKHANKTDLAAHIERSEEHTSELQSRGHLVCRLLLEK